VSLPAVTTIGANAFAFTGTAKALTITLGDTAPTLGIEMFSGVTTGTKQVTVEVPAGATGDGSSPANTTENNWGNAFRGRGWNGTNYLFDSVNSRINLTITEIPAP
jgi:hypothetical protein